MSDEDDVKVITISRNGICGILGFAQRYDEQLGHSIRRDEAVEYQIRLKRVIGNKYEMELLQPTGAYVWLATLSVKTAQFLLKKY
jgi:hypothetical protein